MLFIFILSTPLKYEGICDCAVLKPQVSAQRTTSNAKKGIDVNIANHGTGIFRSWKSFSRFMEVSMYSHSAFVIKREVGGLFAAKMCQSKHQTKPVPAEIYEMPGQPSALLAIKPLTSIANTIPQSTPE